MPRPPLPAPLPWLLAAGLAVGCRAAEPVPSGRAPLEVPDRFAASPDGSAPEPDLERWWARFGDPGLEATFDLVLAGNLDLAAGAARLEAARAQARIAGAALRPSVGARGDAGRQRQNFVGLPIPGGGDVLSTNFSSYGVSLDVSWELDLWGRLDARARAAGAGYRAGEASWRQARLSLAGQAAKSWLALAEARRQRDVARELAESFEQSTGVLRGRFERGRTGPLDLRLAEAQLAGARAQEAAWEEALVRVQRSLELLAGEHADGDALPGGVEAPTDLPALPAPLPTGLPATLLARRPDLLAAEERLRARSLELYAARRDLYPSLSLSASAGRRTADPADLTGADFDVWSWAGNLAVPLFQGGRLRAAIDLADAEVRAALLDWGQALLVAMTEVETALAAEASLARRVEELDAAAGAAASARALAEERYLAGRSDILAVITARQQALDSRRALLTARREHLELRVDLVLALGGDPAAAPPAAAPEPSEPAPAEPR